MTAEISVEFDDRRVAEALQELLDAGRDMRPALVDIGEELVESTLQRFQHETSPSGEKWAPNSPVTLERFYASHKRSGGKKILRQEGFLADDSISYRVGQNFVDIGSDRIYAAVQQFGADAGSFGTDSHGHKLPWGDIPAREFLGLSDGDERRIIDIISDHLVGDLS